MNGYPWYVRLIFWAQRKKYGAVLNSAQVWAKSPQVFLALSMLYGRLDRKSSPLSAGLRSLLIVRVSQLNGCAFCVDLNTSTLLDRGISLEKAQAIGHFNTSNLFNEAEKIALEYAEAVTHSSVSAELKTKMHAAFSEEEIVEITALTAFQNMSTKFNNAFDIAPQGFCAMKEKS